MNLPGLYRRTFASNTILIALGLIAALMVLVSTPTGIGTSPDSINYIAASHSLLAGDGFLRFDGRPFVEWAPLYPVILAALNGIARAIGADFLDIVRWLQAITFSAIVFVSGLFFRRHIARPPLALLATVAVLFGSPLLVDSVYVWSDPLFILLVVVFVYRLPRFLESGSAPSFIELLVIAALASLQRHQGVTLIATGVLSMLVLWQNAPVWRRLRHALIFGVVTAAPLAVWLINNYLQTSTLAGPRQSSAHPLRQNVNFIYDVLYHWFLPDALYIGYLRLGVIVLAVAAVVLAISFRRHGGINLAGLARHKTLPTGLVVTISFVAIYLVSFLVIVSVINFFRFGPNDTRYLPPLYVFLVLFAFLTLERASTWLGGRLKREMVRQALALGVAAVWLVYPASQTLHEIEVRAGWCCQDTEARSSPLVVWLETHRQEGRFYSNTTLPLLYADLYTTAAPRTITQWSRMTLSPERDHYVVLFTDISRYNCAGTRHCYAVPYTIDDLAAVFVIERMADFEDGGVYQLRSR